MDSMNAKTFIVGIVVMIVIAIILSSCGRTKPQTIIHKDSLEYAVYDGTPVIYYEDLEPVYVPMELLGLYRSGDTCWIDTTTNKVVAILPRNEYGQRDTTRLEKVVIGERLDHNVWLKIK